MSARTHAAADRAELDATWRQIHARHRLPLILAAKARTAEDDADLLAYGLGIVRRSKEREQALQTRRRAFNEGGE